MTKLSCNRTASILLLISVAVGGVFSPMIAKASLVDDLQQKIDERNRVISDLEKEISDYQNQIDKTTTEAKTLQSAIRSLDTTKKKLSAEIVVMQNRIVATNFAIDQLNLDISKKKDMIDQDLETIAETVNRINAIEGKTLFQTILNYKTISSFWDEIKTIKDLELAVKNDLDQVRQFKVELEAKENETQDKKKELVGLKNQLADKKKVAEYNRTEKNQLLTKTKNKELTYKKVLQEKIALKDAFERELLQYESQLKFAIDQTSLPAVGSGVLKWPLDSVKITQYFGNTAFALSHPQAYNGQGHNGIDLKASIGTAVRSALAGKVVGAGNTDTVCSGASYGKWVLIEHGNGLSTLYAHLSIIKVAEGQTVGTGDVIGYSGETGYATGPHLHFTVFATQGVRILSHKSKVCGGSYTMPVASFNAYLNPLSYL